MVFGWFTSIVKASTDRYHRGFDGYLHDLTVLKSTRRRRKEEHMLTKSEFVDNMRKRKCENANKERDGIWRI